MVILPWGIYSCVIIKNIGFNTLYLILGLILFIAIYGIVAIYNDFNDYKTDVANNRKDIPYATNSISKKTLLKLITILVGLVVIAGLMLHPSVYIWVGSYLLLGWLYSGPAKIMSRGFLASILLGICYGSLPWLIGVSAAGVNISCSLIFLLVSNLFFSSGTVIIKDFIDKNGDRKTSKNTILVLKGSEYTRHYYLIMTSIAYIILIAACVMFSSIWLIIISPLFLIYNYILLGDRRITTNPKIRAKKSSRSRLIFYTFTVVVYALLPLAII